MNNDDLKALSRDPDGLVTYEYIANHIGQLDEDIDTLIDNMERVDASGQFIASAAHYLSAIDRERYKAAIDRLLALAIQKDRERRYLGDLLPAIWGADYQERADELSASDDNFRRIYKRLFPADGI